jgi:toxin ParE1/3/4
MNLRCADRTWRHLSALFHAADEADPFAAAVLASCLCASMQALRHFPYLGRVGRMPGTLELVVFQVPFVIVYRVEIGDTDQIVILGVYHIRQDEN